MAKRKSQKKKVPSSSSSTASATVDAVLLNNEQHDIWHKKRVVRLVIAVVISLAILIPSAIWIQKLIHTKTEATKKPIIPTSSMTTEQQQHQEQQNQKKERKNEFIDPAKFGGTWDMIMHYSKNYDSKVLLSLWFFYFIINIYHVYFLSHQILLLRTHIGVHNKICNHAGLVQSIKAIVWLQWTSI